MSGEVKRTGSGSEPARQRSHEVWVADARRKIAQGLAELRAGRVAEGERAVGEVIARIRRQKRRHGR